MELQRKMFPDIHSSYLFTYRELKHRLEKYSDEELKELIEKEIST